jgi:5-methylcytosine-specific restriction endonuclease McrA
VQKPCTDCGTTDPGLHYRSGKMRRCHDCQHYANLVKKTTGGGVEFTREEFVAWKRESADRRRCVYCGIGGDELYALNVVNPRTKKRFEVIGVDRRDNSAPYRLDNLDPCCPLCNQIKSQLLSSDEMRELGPRFRRLWDARLARSERGSVPAPRS